MPAVHADSGNQASVAFTLPSSPPAGLSDFLTNMKVKMIEFSDETLGKIDASHLGTTDYRETIPEDLVDAPSVTLTVLFPTAYTPPALGVNLGTMTITFPTRVGETTPATYAGTCYLGSRSLPQLANNTLQEMKLRIDFDGMTGPAFTKSVLAA